MRRIFSGFSQIITVNTNGKNEWRSNHDIPFEVLTDSAIVTEDTIITDIISSAAAAKLPADELHHFKGKTLLPGLVECHTHSMFGGDRADEFQEKLSGISYEEIAKRGGGIRKTVAVTRAASRKQLVALTLPRVWEFISQGVTTLEIKSGYGLDFENELKMLEAIVNLNRLVPIDIVPSFLGAHIIPIEYAANRKKYIDLICDRLMPEIANSEVSAFCDAFCETSAFTPGEVNEIFSAAKALGISTRVHTDQFNSIGGITIALAHQCTSADHLERIAAEYLQPLAASNTVAVLLPGCSFFLNYDYAPARKLIDLDGLVALSTDYNPGSSHILNLHFIMWLAALKMNMSFEEIIAAVTVNAAKAVAKNNQVGSIEIGKKADFAIFDADDYRKIFYHIGVNKLAATVKNGMTIFKRERS